MSKRTHKQDNSKRQQPFQQQRAQAHQVGGQNNSQSQDGESGPQGSREPKNKASRKSRR